MTSRRIQNIALIAATSEALSTQNALDDYTMPIADTRDWGFTQTWSEEITNHTCAFSHDRLKATPKFNLNPQMWPTEERSGRESSERHSNGVHTTSRTEPVSKPKKIENLV